MTGKELIIYILEHDLIDEPIYKNGTFVGFLTVDDAAVKLGVGPVTIHALVSLGKLDCVLIGTKMLIVDNGKMNTGGLDE